MVPRFPRAVLRLGSSGSGLWLWPHMSLAIDHVRVMQRVTGSRSPNPTRSRTHDQWFLWERFSIGLLIQPGNRAGQLAMCA